MKTTVLIAALGDHPAVVTGMVKALREKADIHVDRMHVLYPEEPHKHIAAVGYPLVSEHLADEVEVRPEPLDFPDVNTTTRCMSFLQRVAQILMAYQDRQAYNVIISLAGGRKSMAALLAVVAQLFPAVRGLYHLLPSSHLAELRAFPSIERLLLEMSENEQQAALSPAVEDMNLVPVPYPGAFAAVANIWRTLQAPNDQSLSIDLNPEAQSFYGRILDPSTPTDRLEVWLSKRAYDRYERLKGGTDAKAFLTGFLQMQFPARLKGGKHGCQGQFCYYKRSSTRQRPIFRTEPNRIRFYPERSVTKVVVCGLALELPNGKYDLTIENIQSPEDLEPYRQLSDLLPSRRTLLVPLGESPMIVSQTYELLLRSENEGVDQIQAVAVVYPHGSGAIRSAARMLKTQFLLRGIAFHDYGIRGLSDIDSEDACQTYIRTLLKATDDLTAKYPQAPLALSLSGGRKGMSALTLFAAETAGIQEVYHTLITDPDLESRIENETSLKALQTLPTDTERARRLFLDAYPDEHFTLFSIPVIIQPRSPA